MLSFFLALAFVRNSFSVMEVSDQPFGYQSQMSSDHTVPTYKDVPPYNQDRGCLFFDVLCVNVMLKGVLLRFSIALTLTWGIHKRQI